MIYCKFMIDWPFKAKVLEDDTRYIEVDKKLSKNKSYQIELIKWSEADCLFDIELDTRVVGRDHIGPEISITIWRYYFHIGIYDHRHWDYENKRWEIYND